MKKLIDEHTKMLMLIDKIFECPTKNDILHVPINLMYTLMDRIIDLFIDIKDGNLIIDENNEKEVNS